MVLQARAPPLKICIFLCVIIRFNKMKIVRNSLTKKKHIDDSSLFVVFDVKKKKMIKSTNLL